MDASNASSRHIRAVPDEAPLEARRPLGEILVALGFVSRAELDSALELQRTTGGRIGEILVDKGCLTRIDLACALAEQWEPYPSAEGGESIESSPNGAVPPATEQPEPKAEPRLSPLKGVDGTAEELGQSVAGITSAQATDTLAFEARFATIEAAIADLGGLESRLRGDHDRALADGFRAITVRLDRIESRSGEVAQLEARLGAVSEFATELRGELDSGADHQPGTDPGDRLLELSLRIDRAARDSHDRIVALAAELRAEAAATTAELDARLETQLDAAGAVQRRFDEVQEALATALGRADETAEALHVETGSLAGRLDELFGLRHADAQVARVANERLAARLDEIVASQADEEVLDRLAMEVAELTRRVEQLGPIGRESTRAIERALLEGLADLGKRLTAKATKDGKQGKAMRRSLDSLGAAIAAADARVAEHGSATERDV